MLIVISEWKERAFFDIHDGIPGEFETIPDDADSFLENEEDSGLPIWNSWLGVYLLKDLKETAKTGDWIRRYSQEWRGSCAVWRETEKPEADSIPDEETWARVTPTVVPTGRAFVAASYLGSLTSNSLE